MATVNEKMTSLANEVRNLSGTETEKGIDDMTLDVSEANDEIIAQWSIIQEIKDAVDKLPENTDTSSSVLGTWVFKDRLSPIGVELDSDGNGFGNFRFDFQVYYHEAGIYVKKNDFSIYEYEDETGYRSIFVSYYGDEGRFDWDDAYDGNWMTEAFRRINILTEPTDENFIAWLKENATKENNTDLSDISIEGTWEFNNEITLPEELIGEIPLKYSVYIPWDVEKTVRMSYLNITEISLSYYSGEEGEGYDVEDAYEQGVGWQEEVFKTIIIREEWVNPKLIAWLRANATKVGKPMVFSESSFDNIPYWSCPAGSVAIVDDDSLVGKWEWKDNQSPADLSMFDLQSKFVESIRAHGYDDTIGTVFDIFSFDTNSEASLTIYIGNYILYRDGDFDDQYTTFEIYTDAQYYNDTNTYITIDKFKTFIKTNCNRLSGGKSLFVKENYDWIYKGEIV